MRAADLLRRWEDPPFKPFRIHLSDGTILQITQPGMVIVGLSSAVLPTKFTQEEGRRVASDWRTVALDHIVQFSDLSDRLNGKNRRRKGK